MIRQSMFVHTFIQCYFLTCSFTPSYSGSKLVIQGQHLDSAHTTVVQYISKNPNLQPLEQVS